MRTTLFPGTSRPDSAATENRFAKSSSGGRMQITVLYTSVPAVDCPSRLVRDSADLSSTAHDVSRALRSLGHEVKEIDFGTDARKLVTQLSRAAPQIVVNLAEQPFLSYDKEPHAATLLELLGLPYTGNGPAALALCKNKAHAKQIMLGHGVPTPRFYVLSSSRVPRNGLTFPLVVKPLLEDGSLGVNDESMVTDRPTLRKCVTNVLRVHRQNALVEEFAPGREFNVVVLGNGTTADPYRALPPGEYVYHSQQWRVCTFHAKWDVSHPSYAAVEAQYPARIPAVLSRRLKSYATTCKLLQRVWEFAGKTLSGSESERAPGWISRGAWSSARAPQFGASGAITPQLCMTLGVLRGGCRVAIKAGLICPRAVICRPSQTARRPGSGSDRRA